MAPRIAARHSVMPLLLAVAMTAGSSIATSALGPGPTRPEPTAAAPASAANAAVFGGWTAPAPRGVWSVATKPGYRFPQQLATRVVAPKAAPPKAAPKPHAKPKPKPARVAPRPVRHVSAPVASYKGRNHVWIPALGVNRSVGWYACGTPSAPGLGIYRWGCAGRNNVYLLAHAYAGFRSLHDAYVSGRLRKGMRVMYADGGGRTRTYSVIWWRLTTPTNGAFAYAAQSRPSMTLQTCVGARSQYRLIVRLVALN
jgi:sortase (surface protein transpeptidase)